MIANITRSGECYDKVIDSVKSTHVILLSKIPRNKINTILANIYETSG